MTTPLILSTADGERLAAEWSEPEQGAPSAVVVLCHAHPQYGGSPRDAVTAPLFDALSAAGIACLRFAYRGVDGSTGQWGNFTGEQLDALAALEEAKRRRPTGVPLGVAGYSFGADVALGLRDPELTGWIAVAPPLRYLAPTELDAVGMDARPKLVVLAGRDRVLDAGAAAGVVGRWTATEVAVVPGADHFFIGRTATVTASAIEFLGRLASGTTPG